MDEMIEKGIPPNEFTYSVAITACGNGGQWPKALELLDKMRSMDMKINTITYNSAISALAKAARTESKQQRRFDYDENNASENELNTDPNALWRRVLSLIADMKHERVPLDKFTYSSAINACGAAGRWEEAVGLIREMKEEASKDNKPNKVIYTSAIGEYKCWSCSKYFLFSVKQTFCCFCLFVPQLHVATLANGLLRLIYFMK